MASQNTSQTKVSSEDIVNQKIDLCISNAIVKTGIGFSAGVVLSVLLFRRRSFPVWIGTGFGLGSAYTDCERSFNPIAVPGVRLVSHASNISATSSAPQTTFEKLQQKAGEAFGAAKEKANAGLEQAQDKSAKLADKAQEMGKEALGQAKTEAQKVEDKVWIGSVVEPTTRSTATVEESLTTRRLPGSDCLACRLTGFTAMSGLGVYSLIEAHRMGAFRRGPMPAGVKSRPIWAATLVMFGVGCIGTGLVRLGITEPPAST